MKKLLTILIVFFSLHAVAQHVDEQDALVDSLEQVIKQASHDSTIINAWISWENHVYRSGPDFALELNEKIQKLSDQNLKQALSKSEQDFFQRALGVALNNKGLIFKRFGKYDISIEQFLLSIDALEERGDQLGISKRFNNIANVFLKMGDHASAIDYYNRSLRIKEILDDQKGIAVALNNIGTVYQWQNNYEKSIQYYEKSLVIKETLDDKGGLTSTLTNIGLILSHQGRGKEAIDYLNRALLISKETDFKDHEGKILIHLGNIYGDLNKDSIALDYLWHGLAISQELQDRNSEANAFTEIAAVYYGKTEYTAAVKNANDALSIAKEIGSWGRLKASSLILYKSYSALGKPKQALKMYELYISSRDSLDSKTNQNEIIHQEFKYKYDKQHLSDSLGFAQKQEIEQLAHDAEMGKEANQRYILYVGLGFLLVLSGVVFRGYHRKKKDNELITEQKQEVELQKEIVEEKNTEILDSITYAKRIQEAILPSTKLVNELLPDSFVFYKPKDIVAGDFYWMETVDSLPIVLDKNTPTSNGKPPAVLFAAADCTGHGVPGAMVSVVCNNAMNRALREFGLTQPGAILDKTRELVVKTFEKSEEDVKDGMDIALCSLEGNTLKYAGAHNPLWIIKNGEVLETKANKQPIGKFDNQVPYTTHSFELEKGDTIYIFSDGYVDQFGGEKGKKFKTKAFRELLISIQDKKMVEQRVVIDNTFEAWKGNLEQVDDVCVIGVRV